MIPVIPVSSFRHSDGTVKFWDATSSKKKHFFISFSGIFIHNQLLKV